MANADDSDVPNVIYGEYVSPDGHRTQTLKYPSIEGVRLYLETRDEGEL